MVDGKGWRGRGRRFWVWFVTFAATTGTLIALAIGRWMGF
jgi:hypothetical protein